MINRLETSDKGNPGQSIHLYFGRWVPLGQALPIYRYLPYEIGVRILHIDSPMGRSGNLEKSEKLVDVNPT